MSGLFEESLGPEKEIYKNFKPLQTFGPNAILEISEQLQ